MENPRPEKVAVVDEVRERFEQSDAAIVTEYRGLSVGEMASLRIDLTKAGGEYKVYKNTLVRFAVQDRQLDEFNEMLTGPTAIAFVKGDAAAVAKTLRDFSKGNPNLIIKGGLLGDKILTEKDTSALANLPSREVLLAKLAGLMAAPMQQFAGLLQALPRNFAYGLKALADQGGAEGAPADAPAEPTSQPTAEAEAPAEADPEAEGSGDSGESGQDPAEGSDEATDEATPEAEAEQSAEASDSEATDSDNNDSDESSENQE